MIRILKQSRHNFSGKHICDGGQNSWFCKASLRICYVSLFECKGAWMLKTVINCHELDWKSTMYSLVKLSSYFCVQYFLSS